MLQAALKEKVIVEENLQDYERRRKEEKVKNWKEKALHSEFGQQISVEAGEESSLKLPDAFVSTERHIQLCVVSVAMNHGTVHLDIIKQFACIDRKKQWPKARAL